jgi:ankyrin repeat protein
MLLKEKPDVNSRDTDGNTVLHISVINGNSKLVGLLLYHEA